MRSAPALHATRCRPDLANSGVVSSTVRGARRRSLLETTPTWTAEAERFEGYLAFASAVGATAEEAWARLRSAIDADGGRITSEVRLLRS